MKIYHCNCPPCLLGKWAKWPSFESSSWLFSRQREMGYSMVFQLFGSFLHSRLYMGMSVFKKKPCHCYYLMIKGFVKHERYKINRATFRWLHVIIIEFELHDRIDCIYSSRSVNICKELKKVFKLFKLSKRKWAKTLKIMSGNLILGWKRRSETGFWFNPLLPKSDLQILLCLTPDYFTGQRETSWALKGQGSGHKKGFEFMVRS